MKRKHILLALLIGVLVTAGFVYIGYQNNIFIDKNPIRRIGGYVCCLIVFVTISGAWLLYWIGEDKKKNSG